MAKAVLSRALESASRGALKEGDLYIHTRTGRRVVVLGCLIGVWFCADREKRGRRTSYYWTRDMFLTSYKPQQPPLLDEWGAEIR